MAEDDSWLNVDHLLDHDRELEAQNEAMAMDNDECLVPGTANELYDCCGSDFILGECKTFGVINALILGGLIISIFVLHFKSRWFHSQWLLTFTLFFQVLPALWRTIFLLHGAYPGVSSTQFITYRSSDSGDFVVSLTAFAMYMYQLKVKFEHEGDEQFDYKRKKCILVGLFWLFFAVYSVYWGSFYWISLDKENLSYVDFATSFYFGVLIVVYLTMGVSLIHRIQEKNIENNVEKTVGVKQIILILVFSCTFMFLRMVFVSLPDIAKINRIDSISKNTQSWPYMFGVISLTNILACLFVIMNVYWIHESEKAIAVASEKLSID